MFVPLWVAWVPTYLILSGCFSSIRLKGKVSAVKYIPFVRIALNGFVILFLTNSTISSPLLNSKRFYSQLRQNAGQLMGRNPYMGRSKYIYKTFKSLKPFGIKDETGRPLDNVRAGNTILFTADSLMTLLVSYPPETFS